MEKTTYSEGRLETRDCAVVPANSTMGWKSKIPPSKASVIERSGIGKVARSNRVAPTRFKLQNIYISGSVVLIIRQILSRSLN